MQLAWQRDMDARIELDTQSRFNAAAKKLVGPAEKEWGGAAQLREFSFSPRLPSRSHGARGPARSRAPDAEAVRHTPAGEHCRLSWHLSTMRTGHCAFELGDCSHTLIILIWLYWPFAAHACLDLFSAVGESAMLALGGLRFCCGLSGLTWTSSSSKNGNCWLCNVQP